MNAEHVTTGRLRLDRVDEADLDDMAALHADPRVWEHFPAGRHTSRERTEQSFATMDAGWVDDGLGYWSVRTRDDGEYLGTAGCARPTARPWWNLYYRIRPEAQGHGFAAEVARAAIVAAHETDPDRPVVAALLKANHGSRRTAQAAGLRLIWRGPEPGHGVRLVFADRPLTASTLVTITGPH